MYINTISDYRKAIRHPYAWPGGYRINAYADDGSIICRDCLTDERRQILEAIRDNDRSGWRVIAFDVYWEGPAENCGHCGKEIESEYGDPESQATR